MALALDQVATVEGHYRMGWSGYAIDPMQRRWGALRAGILLGLVWAGWHLVPLIQAHRSPVCIAGWSLGTLANRVIIVWLYNKSGRSVLAASLYRAISNVSWQIFPNHGSHYNPIISGPLLIFTAALVLPWSNDYASTTLATPWQAGSIDEPAEAPSRRTRLSPASAWELPFDASQATARGPPLLLMENSCRCLGGFQAQPHGALWSYIVPPTRDLQDSGALSWRFFWPDSSLFPLSLRRLATLWSGA